MIKGLIIYVILTVFCYCLVRRDKAEWEIEDENYWQAKACDEWNLKHNK